MRNRILASVALLCGLALAGCDSFDPLDKLQDWDIMGSSKTPLKGERRQVFPEGVPGVAQGVPPDLVKGYQAPAEEPPPVVEAKPAKPAPRPKRVVVAKPKKPPAPPRQQQTQSQPQQQQQAQPQQSSNNDLAPANWGDPPQPTRQAPAAARTTTQQAPSNAAAWPTMPGAQPAWPSQAQPAPQR